MVQKKLEYFKCKENGKTVMSIKFRLASKNESINFGNSLC